jgi:monofunctional biosynthetic peptidoglycan transglycosylase
MAGFREAPSYKVMAYAQAIRRSAPRRISRWMRRLFLAFAGVVFVIPVGLILLFRYVPPPFTPLMVERWWTGGPITAKWVPLNAISPNLVRAVIASEDTKFCSHHGFDWDAIDRAIEEDAAGDRLRGGSTISQQTAKNLFLSPARSWMRKGLEAWLTVLIEEFWPKRRIIETYLNVAEWGPQRFGAEAAARADFGKPAAALSVNEAARLATVLPNPRSYRARDPGPYVLRQSQIVAARMAVVRRDRLDSCIFDNSRGAA